MSEKKYFYVTTPIYYPNGLPHMGHAYSTCVADVLARYHKMVGDETYFLTGTDENSSKVVKKAEAEGKTPQEYTSEVVEYFKKFYTNLDISFDQFIRTSDEKTHWEGATKFWNMFKSEDIYKNMYTGLYCVGAESFVTEKDLVNGMCPSHDEPPVKIEEENYFFKLSAYTERVKKAIECDEIEIIPKSRKNEILSFLDTGMQDISFSRPKTEIPWGIPVPDHDDQTMYVWCDALTNYVTALNFAKEGDLYKNFWPASVHVIGKDILRFHAAIWPAMLMSAGLPLPKKILAHGMILSGGRKMSKSLGNTLDPQVYIDTYGVDALRYYLVREISPFDDGDMTEERFIEVYTANLVNGIGNLTNRILKMSEDHVVGFRVQENELPHDYIEAFESLNIQKAADVVWERIGALDAKIQETEPFKLIKVDKEKAIILIKELVQELSLVAKMIEPIMPQTSDKIIHAIKENKKPETPIFNRL